MKFTLLAATALAAPLENETKVKIIIICRGTITLSVWMVIH